MDRALLVGSLLMVSAADAETRRVMTPDEKAAFEREHAIAPQLQIDGGLSVIGLAYERPIGARLAIAPEAFVFGTYFLPWFDLGDDMVGGGAGVRVTWFARDDGRGLYVTPYVRAAIGNANDDDGDASGRAYAVTGGAFVGYAFAVSSRIDVRLGGGLQWIWIHGDETGGASTPFVAIDGVVGYRF